MSPRKLVDGLPDRVLVYARVKPASDSEDSELATSCNVVDVGISATAPPVSKTLTVTNRMAACVSKSFAMDRVLGPTCTQKDVYEAVGAPVLVFDGDAVAFTSDPAAVTSYRPAPPLEANLYKELDDQLGVQRRKSQSAYASEIGNAEAAIDLSAL